MASKRSCHATYFWQCILLSDCFFIKPLAYHSQFCGQGMLAGFDQPKMKIPLWQTFQRLFIFVVFVAVGLPMLFWSRCGTNFQTYSPTVTLES